MRLPAFISSGGVQLFSCLIHGQAVALAQGNILRSTSRIQVINLKSRDYGTDPFPSPY